MIHGKRHCIFSCLALFAIVLPMTAAAQDKPVPVTFGTDDRHIADTSKSPWNAVGRVNSSVAVNSDRYGFYFCSGTLIAPNIVATMAGCVADFRDKSNKLYFVTGDLRGDYQETSAVKCVSFVNEGVTENWKSDVALLVLAKSLRADPLPLSVATDFAPGTSVSHGGYGGDRPFVLSVHEKCNVRSVTKSGDIVTDCDMAQGQGGGPILVRKDGAWQVAGLMAWAVETQGSGGPLASTWRHQLAVANCQ
jgi:protease YdgD